MSPLVAALAAVLAATPSEPRAADGVADPAALGSAASASPQLEAGGGEGGAPGGPPPGVIPAVAMEGPQAPDHGMPGPRPDGRAPREWHLFGGWGGLRLAGVEARGLQGRLAFGVVPGSGTVVVLAGDFFKGETAPGLSFGSFTFAPEVWFHPVRRLRVGIGSGWAWGWYTRATNGHRESFLALALRGGVELTLARWDWGALVLGGHAAARTGPWYSAVASLGARWGPAAPRPRADPAGEGASVGSPAGVDAR